MIKVCYIIGQLTKGGAEKQLFELVRGIDREEFDPAVISLSRGGYWAEEIRKAGVPVFELERKKSFELKRLINLIRLLKSLTPDIVHTYLFSANSYGRVAALVLGVPVIIASERNSPEIGKDKNRYQMLIDKLLAGVSHGIICNSFRASETLVKQYYFSRNKVFTVHNGVRVSSVFTRRAEQTSENPGCTVIGTVGRLAPQKNHRLFLETAKVILGRGGKSKINFLIVGGGDMRQELERHAANIGIKNDVMFAGERQDVPDLLNSMDVYVMTSLYEGMSNAIMEAMAVGLPVVALDVGGNRELVVDGKTGFICQSHDAHTLASRIEELIEDRERARSMGEKGMERILREFGVEKMVQETERIYVALANKPLSPRRAVRTLCDT